MLYMAAKRNLMNLASRYPVVLMTGMRNAGKASLARSCFPGRSFVDLEDSNMRALVEKSPRTFLLAFPDGAIINQVHLAGGLAEAVRYHVDRCGIQSGRYILLSSLGIDEAALGDRLAHMVVNGLSVEDFDRNGLLSDNPFQTIHKGQIPAVLEGRLSFDGFLDAILENDISTRINGSSKAGFMKFITNCALAGNRGLSMNHLAGKSGVSAPTVKSWLRLLEQANVITVVRSEKGTMARLFFNDSGLLCRVFGIASKEELILSSHKEDIVDSFVFSELSKGRLSHGHSLGMSVAADGTLLADWKQKYALVVEPNIEITQASLEAVAKRKKDTDRKVLILHLGDVTYTDGGTDCVSYRDWAKIARGVDYFS